MTDTTTKAGRSLHLFGANFTPKMLPTLFLLVFVPLFCSLGTWQYHRAQYKKQLLNDLALRQSHKPLKITDIHTPKSQEFYPVKIEGQLAGADSLLVQNKFFQHQLGFVVLTPLHLKDGTTVLIERGWVARNQLQSISKQNQTVSIHGIITLPPDKIFQIGDKQIQDHGFTVLQNHSWHEIEHAIKPTTSRKLRPFILVLDANSPASFERIYTPTIMPPSKHMGYAVQWFAMALAVFGIFVFTSRHKND